eukprot:g31673.t1
MELASCVDEDNLTETTFMRSRLEANTGDHDAHLQRLENLEVQQRDEQARLNTESAALKARLQALELRLAAAALEKISAQACSAHQAQEHLEVRMARLEAGLNEEVFNKDLKIINSLSRGDLKELKEDVDSRALDGMTPFQEYCNALSMLIPGFVCAYLYHHPEELRWTWRMSLMSFAVLIHLPFSFRYHCLLAQRKLKDAVDNTARRLDQSFIHVTCMATFVALSNNEVYVCCAVILNLYFIARLWAPDASLLERMGNIGCGVVLYGLPPLCRGAVRHGEG